ncbi:MAG TPA: transcriptional regulator [Synergistaceae bacterium]|nr:transcriptional regulator [Synergistaceae bacterium]
MKLSTKTRYGLRALLYMAERYDDGTKTVSVGEISRERKLSEKYLEQLFIKLKRRNIITSTRGAQGGYRLVASPEETTVASVVEALEGPISFADCVAGKGCREKGTCLSHGLWKRLKGSIDEILEGTTLADLLVHPGGRDGGAVEERVQEFEKGAI